MPADARSGPVFVDQSLGEGRLVQTQPARQTSQQILQKRRAVDIEQQFRRAVFNLLIRNQDDHVKNIAFLMDRIGAWRLSRAYDVAYAYNPSGPWTRQHQMSLNGKRDDFDLEDLVAFGGYCGFSRRRALALVEEVSAPVSAWRAYADDAGVHEADAVRIQRALRLELKAARPA